MTASTGIKEKRTAMREASAREFVARFNETYGGAGPSIGAIAKAIGVKDRKQAERVVSSLTRKGYIRRTGEIEPGTTVRSIQAVKRGGQ